MAATVIWFIGVSFVEPREALPLWGDICQELVGIFILGVDMTVS